MNSAFFRRNIFETVFQLKSRSPRLAYWRDLEKTQYLSTPQLKELQWNRLNELWHYLWQNNDFYRRRFLESGLHESDLRNIQDIGKIPILNKKDIRFNGDAMISSGYKQSDLHHFKTGGSTGKALDIYITEECSELRNACARRHDRWTGWEPGEPIGAAWGNPKIPKKIKEKLLDACVQPYIYLDTMSVTDESVRQFAASWAKKKPTLLFGHAHSLFLLARKVQELDITVIRPIGILSTSMMLLPHERAVIEQVFGKKVTDRYGCEEVSLIASECDKHEGMHMNIEHLVIEFIKADGSYAEPGEPGLIVVTDLMNKAMPFVRYKVEDVGVPLGGSCSCGRGLPLMEKIAGRVADFLIKRDGTKVAGISLIENTLTKIPGIDQMQIVQTDLDRMQLNIVPGEQYCSASEEELVSYFENLFGDIRITLRKVTEIKPEKSGKFRFSICDLN